MADSIRHGAGSRKPEDMAGLGACWGAEKALEMQTEAGFSDVRMELLGHDTQNANYIARK